MGPAFTARACSDQAFDLNIFEMHRGVLLGRDVFA